VAKIVVPTPNTVITSAWGKTVADAINAGHAQHGIATLTFTAGIGTRVTFPVPFFTGAAVTVLVCPYNSPFIFIVPYSTLNTVGFDVHGFSPGGAALNGNASLGWIAVGGRN